jgi:hypothetical protein
MADREVRARFLDLSRELGELGAWVRLHYVYPYPHVDEVIPLMAEGKVLPYLDIPFQHASPNVLKTMRRPAHAEKTLDRIARWREICPDLALRSTFIVGFPGETEEDFQMLLDWLDEAKDRSCRLLQIRAGQGRALGTISACRPFRKRSRRPAGAASWSASRRSPPADEEEGRQAPARHHRFRRTARRRTGAPATTRPRSTARCVSPRAAPCGSATSSR